MNLKILFHIQEVLKETGYFDISRIANEIYTYSIEKNIPLNLILERISNQEPWEYIQGFVDFRGRKFLVTKDTLIPRIESEQLVDIAKDLILKNDIKTVIDLGTGSGCLIISIAHEIENQLITFVGIDISQAALNIAKKNGSTGKIYFYKKDLICKEELEDNTLIVANLPYIPTKMYEELDRSVKEYEPRLALDGGSDGLLYYKRLIEQIRLSKKEIFLLIEIEPSTLTELTQATNNIPFEVFKDFRKRNRFVLFNFS